VLPNFQNGQSDVVLIVVFVRQDVDFFEQVVIQRSVRVLSMPAQRFFSLAEVEVFASLVFDSDDLVGIENEEVAWVELVLRCVAVPLGEPAHQANPLLREASRAGYGRR